MPSSDYLRAHDRASIDSDDDDLDLEELDPSSTYNASRISRDEPSPQRPLAGPGIALRNLRVGAGNRRLWKRSMSGNNEEDTAGLLENSEEAGLRPSHASSRPYADDDAPLLDRRGSTRSIADGARPPSRKSRLGWLKPSALFGSGGAVGGRRRKSEDVVKPPRDVLVGQAQRTKYPANVVSNAKYTPWSFLPRTLYNEFSFFFNIYFLLVALSQIIPVLRIGYMSTYIAPLAFVVSISLGKEALDDIGRRRRDAEANAEEFSVLALDKTGGSRAFPAAEDAHSQRENVPVIIKRSRDLKVGDVLKVRKNQRLPADVIILKSISNDATAQEVQKAGASTDIDRANEGSSSSAPEQEAAASADQSIDSASDTFIRTDQLDGETDWKLRLPSALSQTLNLADFTRLKIAASGPDKRVNEFVGNIELMPPSGFYDPHPDRTEDASDEDETEQNSSAPLTIDNTAWANTVLASNTITYAAIIYTGSQTRAALSTSPSRSKVGLLECEINNLTKILCALTLTLSIILVALEGFQPTNDKEWYVAIMIYLILFSTIIPMSLRVNLDMAKSVYGRFIERDKDIPDTVVRTSTIPEDLGRIEYLLSDKTGTLTQNEMELKKIHVGTVSYANDAMEEVASYVRQSFAGNTLTTAAAAFGTQPGLAAAPRTRREIGSRVRDVVLALALCHNVTPTTDEEDGVKVTSYQASSPDEIAIVRYTEEVGLKVSYRDRQTIALESTDTGHVVVRVRILDIFPFTSDSKRMGIIVKFDTDQGNDILNSPTGEEEIWFYQKGADTVMTSIVAANDWLDEETANMAREGLRTLVVGRKRLSSLQYQEFANKYKQASLSLQGRDIGMAKVVSEHLERELELLGVTGVEDRLQRDVKPSLELLRNAGVKIWMLTGDKVETARCVAISAKLVARGQYIHTVAKVKDRSAAQEALDFLRNKTDCCLLIDGESLALMLSQFRSAFISVAVLLPAVIACRCSPTQKAEVADLIRQHTKKRVCCIGDGGNDVSMIQAADVGIGIVGKEGRQASLAADFSVTQFHHITKLLVWHGRNSYKRSAKLAQFIMHRGLIISACQTMYSIASHFDPKGLFINWLMVGYATVYTNAPVFSLVLDRDVDEQLANLYPELYKELKTGRSLSYRSFFTWVLVSVYQGAVIQGLSQILLDAITGKQLISISFTALVINELVMVAIAVTTWHPVMIFCLLGTALLYAASIPFLGDYFDLKYVITLDWVWRVVAVVAVSIIPVWAAKLIKQSWSPPSYRKVRG
ncbi:hypothetical protein BDV18DRAFT_145585 [Aspergillus unguis]